MAQNDEMLHLNMQLLQQPAAAVAATAAAAVYSIGRRMEAQLIYWQVNYYMQNNL